MAKCPMCTAEVGCPCNLKTSKDGQKKGCISCIAQYNNSQNAQSIQNVDYSAIAQMSSAPEIKSVKVKYNNYNV